jgi:hypothetical protein
LATVESQLMRDLGKERVAIGRPGALVIGDGRGETSHGDPRGDDYVAMSDIQSVRPRLEDGDFARGRRAAPYRRVLRGSCFARGPQDEVLVGKGWDPRPEAPRSGLEGRVSSHERIGRAGGDHAFRSGLAELGGGT